MKNKTLEELKNKKTIDIKSESNQNMRSNTYTLEKTEYAEYIIRMSKNHGKNFSGAIKINFQEKNKSDIYRKLNEILGG